MAQGSVIVPLQMERAAEEALLLEYAMRTSRGAVYLHCMGPAGSSPPMLATLDLLTHCFQPSAHSMPRCDVFPLLPYLGWTAAQLAACLKDAEEVVAAAEHADECWALLDELNTARQRSGLPSLSLTLTAGHQAAAGAAAEQQQQQQQQQSQQQPGADRSTDGAAAGEGAAPGPGPHSRVIGDWQGPVLQFQRVAVGGTFDRLHAGHRLLLAATALVSTQDIFVGITADQLLASKRNRDLLEPYAEREAAVLRYLRTLNPRATVVAGPLTDPKEPPLCAVDPEFDAIVVSEETILGAHAINKARAERGFPPVAIVVVGLIYSAHRTAKLSSTDLREQDALPGGGARSGSPAPAH